MLNAAKEAVDTNVQNKSSFVLLFKLYKHINIWEISSVKTELQLFNFKNKLPLSRFKQILKSTSPVLASFVFSPLLK